jgi:hypothetical protein
VDHSSLGIATRSIESLIAEDPDLVDKGVLPTACINKFTRDNRGLMIHHEPDDLDTEALPIAMPCQNS